MHVFTTEELAVNLRSLGLTSWLVRQEQPITHLDSEPAPDISVVQGTLKNYFDSHPTAAQLVIEVAVSGTEFGQEKRKVYASAEVPEYWIVVPE